ncbi:MAG: sulfatase [Akkermansiaceae bacterium]
MAKNYYLHRLISIIFLSSACIASASERPSQPNIVVLLTDDLGWQDVVCYDIDEPNANPYRTPVIDGLAKKGIKFWRAYSPAPTCAPSRCAIVSGVHPARAQKTHIKGGTPPRINSKDGNNRMLSPWFSARTPVGDYTMASAMKDNGYRTGHVGKWHISYSAPKAVDLGFDVSYGSRVSKALMKNRLKDFATTAEDDPYRLDENGFPFNKTTDNAINFLKESKAKPFFLYYATWLVHAPIQTRSEALLKKYAEEMGIDYTDKKNFDGTSTGQVNPFYAAMVEELDYNIGLFLNYLETTEDPRWPGHMLIENTYIIFTSDNGGTEGKVYERYTDNNPLDLGKTSIKEGGIRVPFIVTGPNIAAGVESDVLINGLDIYPTVVEMAGAKLPEKTLDGLSIFPLLTQDPKNPALVKDAQGKVRDEMMWHFPHTALESALIRGDYKLIKNYDHVNNPKKAPFELYQLYTEESGKRKRLDIEEAKNIAASMPELVKSMDQELMAQLTEMKASYPYYSPHYEGDLPNKEKVPTEVAHRIKDNLLKVTYKENGAKVVRADLIYTTQKTDKGYQEWFPAPMDLKNQKATIELPADTQYFYVNLIDENQFLTCYPSLKGSSKVKKFSFMDRALTPQSKPKN